MKSNDLKLLEEAYLKITEKSLFERKVPSGLYWMIDDVSVNGSYRNRGIGLLLYKLVLTCGNEQIKGIISARSNKLSTAQHVSKIYKSLGGLEVKGKNDVYDIVLKTDWPDELGGHVLRLISKAVEGERIFEVDDIIFMLRKFSFRHVVVEALNKGNGSPVGFISASAFKWNSALEQFDFS